MQRTSYKTLLDGCKRMIIWFLRSRCKNTTVHILKLSLFKVCDHIRMLDLKTFYMTDKTIIEIGFRIISRIMQISRL